MSGYFGGGNSEWTLVERITIGSAQQNQDFAAVLSGNVDLGYKIKCFIKNDAAASPLYSLRVNGSAMVSDRRYINAASASVSTATTASSNVIMVLGDTADEGTFEAVLDYSRTGFERLWRFASSKFSGSTDVLEETIGRLKMTTPATSTNITSLGLGCNTVAGIGVSSILELYRKGA